MKMLFKIFVVLSVFSVSAYAQQSEFSGKLGMTAGAFNLGADYVKNSGDYGLGGYVFLQAAKDKNNSPLVTSVTAFGVMAKLVLVEKNTIKAYVAPGVGITMVKDGSVNAVGRFSDENIIGPTFKIGVQFIKTKDFAVGIERMQFSNWFNDSLNNFAGPSEYYSVVGSWSY